MSLPEVNEVRRRIEACQDRSYRMYLKALYLCGAARAVELAARRCSGENADLIYGPKGTDVWLSETDPPDLTNMQFLKLLLQINNHKRKIDEIIDELSQKVKVAVFKIKIAKQHLEEKEELPYRLVALPIPQEYEPWTQDLYDYFHDAGEELVFPFNRQTVWHYITKIDPIFQGLTYRIKKYTYMTAKAEVLETGTFQTSEPNLWNRLLATPADEYGLKRTTEGTYEYRLDFRNMLTRKEIYKILPHTRSFKLHALRHERTDELITKFHFDGIDLGAYVGWSMGSSQKVSDMPAMAGNYAEIREAWPRYIKKLCMVHNN